MPVNPLYTRYTRLGGYVVPLDEGSDGADDGRVFTRTSRIRFDSHQAFRSWATYKGGTSGGWRLADNLALRTPMTGPGRNSPLPYMHTETDGTLITRRQEAKGTLTITLSSSAFAGETGRSMDLRCCIQGHFSHSKEGLYAEFKEAGDGAKWGGTIQIPGWPYSDSYEEGDTLYTYSGPNRRCVLAGGWADVHIPIPNSAAEIRIRPDYVDGDQELHDIGLYQVVMRWEV